jgi:hypothetical protein
MNPASDASREEEKDLGEHTAPPVANAEGHPMNEPVDPNILVGPRSLNEHQKAILRELTRLHLSLGGPQDMLETAGDFNRLPFPSPYRQPR